MNRSLLVAAYLFFSAQTHAADPVGKEPVKAAVIGGLILGGLWPELTARFTSETGWPVELAASGQKAALAQALKAGRADVVTLHSGDEATELVADGFASDMKPWACNEHCIMGPAGDPAGIRGMKDGAAALKKIAETRSRFVDSMGSGSREVSHRLWTAAGVEAKGDWVLKDDSAAPQGVVEFAAARNAYVIVGRVPVLKGKIPTGGMEIMVQGDPAMRRLYVVMVADARRFPAGNHAGAKALSDWVTGERGQAFLREYGARQPDGSTLLFPSASEGAKR